VSVHAQSGADDTNRHWFESSRDYVEGNCGTIGHGIHSAKLYPALNFGSVAREA
jgi:hypothetical protein